MSAQLSARNSLRLPPRAPPSRTTSADAAWKGVVPSVPTEFTQALDWCLEAGSYGSHPVELSCAGSGFRARIDRAEVRGESEFVCLADGVWLISAAWHVDANLLAWARHNRTLC